jgi:hypothetical protein
MSGLVVWFDVEFLKDENIFTKVLDTDPIKDEKNDRNGTHWM